MMSVLRRRCPRRACLNSPTSPYTSLIYACLLLLSCLGPATGESPEPPPDAPAAAGPCLTHDPPCSSSSFSDPSRTSTRPHSAAKEGSQTSTSSSEHIPKNPEAEIPRTFDLQTEEDKHEAMEEEDVEREDGSPEAERVLNCILSSVPLIGGKWLAKIVRHSFSDATLLEASHSFLEGGELVARFIDLGTTSSAAKMINIINSCLEDEDDFYSSESSASGYSEDEVRHQNDYLESISNSVDTDRGAERAENTPPRSKAKPSSSPLPHHRRKRRITRSLGYGSDSLLGFNLLAFLVFCALLTYLAYLLIS